MTQVLFATKQRMGEAYVEGTRLAVTSLTLHPLTVSAIQSDEKNGYQSTQVTFGKKHRREIPFVPGLSVGDKIIPSEFLKPGSTLSIQGTSKGKGFAGVIKRWGFAGGFKTHGQSDRHRAPGSIGQGTTPGRVHRGKKMPGRMGSDTKSVKTSLTLAVNDLDVWVTGPVPGHSGSLLTLKITGSKNAPKLDFVTGGITSTPSDTKDIPSTKKDK